MSIDMQLVGEEILGAELVAGKGLAQAAGAIWDILERGCELQRQQLKFLVDDYTQYINDISSPGMNEWPEKFSSLVNRRQLHISAGWREAATLVKDDYLPLQNIWSDYLSVVRQDWQH